MISCLVVAICVLVFWQKSRSRRATAAIYALVVAGYSVVAYHAPADQSSVFFSGAALDVAIISLVALRAGVYKPTRLAGNLIDVCLISIGLNCLGFVSWSNGLTLEAYNLSYGALYLIAIISLLREERADGHQPNKRHLYICGTVRRCAGVFCALPEQRA